MTRGYPVRTSGSDDLLLGMKEGISQQIRKDLSAFIEEGTRIWLLEALNKSENQQVAIEREIKKLRATRRKKEKQEAQILQGNLDDARAYDDFSKDYQRWFSKSLRVVEQLLPDRLSEFRELYRLDKPAKAIKVTTYTVSDYLHGLYSRDRNGEPTFNTAATALRHVKLQLEILSSAESRIDSLLADISGTIEASLADDELEAAKELRRTKHLRSAGVVAGVVLERHLKVLVSNHGVGMTKKPLLGNLNDALKEASVYSVPEWRHIQRLADLRNLCAHDADRDPSEGDLDDLISGVEHITSTVF